jgi:LmbE family N-acetylglucosaminyl deacetylase
MDTCYLLVIAAHPDDPEFGIAGTVARMVKEGKEVIYVICTSGNKGSSDSEMTMAKLAAIREQEQLAAANVLGVKKVVFLGHDDQSLEDTPEFRKEIVRQIRTFKPQVVATSDPYRRYIWHRDHRIVGQVVLDAVFPFARDSMAYPDLMKMGLEPHKVKEVLLWGTEQPDYISDITDTYEIKLRALHCHHSQLDHHPPEWESRIRGMFQATKGDDSKLVERFHRAEILW